MAVVTKKDKLIEEAQKFVLRGQLDKAIKNYEQIVALEPSAINLRQKLADLLVKSGRIDDARVQLENIGKYYSTNGFYLKSIAVYKQLQKFFPTDIAITLTLAGLNEKHGLVANALSEYKQVFDYHEKAGNVSDALKILELMQQVDAQNINIKIKLAEAYYKHDKLDEAYSMFAKTASLLQERSDNATLVKLTARIQQLFPAKSEFMLEVLSDQITSGNAANAINGLQAMLRTNPHDKRIWELVVEAYTRLNQPQRLKVAFQHFHKFFPNEVTAIAGVVSGKVADSDVKGALALLTNYEDVLLAANRAEVLDQSYRELDRLDPINSSILQGWLRVCEASGKIDEAATISSKLNSLRNVSGKTQPTAIEDTTEPAPADIFGELEPDASVVDVTVLAEVDSLPLSDETALSLTDCLFVALPVPDAEDDDEIEIEVDIDIDIDDVESPFAQDDSASWLDSVGDLFDSITTSPRGIKFGHDMDSSDAQSHYDLGLAFKEMGLFDEAINEFRVAAKDPTKRIDCMILQGVCLRDRGELDTAANVLSSLMKPGLDLEDQCAVKYELALTYVALGNNEQASLLFSEIDIVNPGFRDVSSRLDSNESGESLDFSDDDLLGFDLK